MIKAEGVSYTYGPIRALDAVSLEAGPGGFLGIIGPNGSGKSTLLSVLAGILTPDSGQVSLAGRSMSSWISRDRAKLLALVLQENFFPFDFTALEVALMGRSPHLGELEPEGQRDLETVQEAMEACDCWEIKGRSIRELSGGERQRVVLARALAQQPKYLLMDEPANHLDLSHQSRILGHVADLCRERALTAIAVFHDLNLASRFCGRLALLNQGRLVRQGAPENVLEPALIAQAYRSEITLLKHPTSGSPVVIPQ